MCPLCANTLWKSGPRPEILRAPSSSDYAARSLFVGGPWSHHLNLNQDVIFGIQCKMQHVQLPKISIGQAQDQKRVQCKRMFTFLALQMLECFAKKKSSHFVQLFFVLQVVFLTPFVLRISFILTILVGLQIRLCGVLAISSPEARFAILFRCLLRQLLLGLLYISLASFFSFLANRFAYFSALHPKHPPAS